MFKLVIVACLLVAVQLTLSAPSTDAPATATDNNSTSSEDSSSAANSTGSDEKHIVFVTPKPLLLNAPGGINQRNRRYAQVNNERGVFPGAIRGTSAPAGSTEGSDDAIVSTNSTTS